MLCNSPAVRPLLRRLALVLLGSFAVLALAGCGIFSPDESNDDGGGGGGFVFLPPYVSAGEEGRNQAISNLEASYEEMDYDEYFKLINDLYVFRIDPDDLEAVGQLELGRDQDLESTEDMFAGLDGTERVLDEQGQWTGETVDVPGVEQIRLSLTPASGSPWTLMEDGEFAGSWRRIYDVDMTVTFRGASRVESIRGKQTFYLIPGTVTQGEEVLNVWQLRAWEDQGIDSI